MLRCHLLAICLVANIHKGSTSTEKPTYVALPGGNISFHPARRVCQARNGDLPKPRTLELWTALLASVDSMDTTQFYLGIQRDDEGIWRWVGENDEATFTLMLPIDDGYDCARAIKSASTIWMPEPCVNNLQRQLSIVCEIGVAPTTAVPSTQTTQPAESIQDTSDVTLTTVASTTAVPSTQTTQPADSIQDTSDVTLTTVAPTTAVPSTQTTQPADSIQDTSGCHCRTPGCGYNVGGNICNCLEGFELNGSMACQDIDECVLFGNKPCGKNTCVNVDGSYRCECQDGNDESVGGKICTHQIWYGTKGSEKEDRRNHIKLPDDPVVKVTIIALSLWIIGYLVYVGVMMCKTVAKATYLFVTTESVNDEDEIEDDDYNGQELVRLQGDDHEGVDRSNISNDAIDIEVGGTKMSRRTLRLFASHMFTSPSMSKSTLSQPILPPLTRIQSGESFLSGIAEESKIADESKWN